MMNKWSKPYQILRFYFRLVHISFYDKIIVEGKENIPSDKPVIFAPNHQNALMDPAAIIFSQKSQVVFLTRADIFNNPILLKVFTFLKMLPVYRIRDGARSLQNNERIFNESVNILESPDPVTLALFPEARHTDRRHLWPLKKAVQRIAFRALEKNDYNIDIQIIPTGIYYSKYTDSNSVIQINYGKPISVNDFAEIYKDNNQKGMQALKEEMSDRIKEQIIHIDSLDNHDTFEFVRLFLRDKNSEAMNHAKKDFFQTDQYTIETMHTIAENAPDTYTAIEKKTEEIKQECKKLDVPWEYVTTFRARKWFAAGILSILSLPIFLYAFVNHFIFYFLIQGYLKSKIKDAQFHSSVKFSIGMLAPVSLFLIQAGIFAIFLPQYFWYYYLSLSVSAILGLKIKSVFTFFWKRKSVFFLKTFRKAEYQKIIKQKEELVGLFNTTR